MGQGRRQRRVAEQLREVVAEQVRGLGDPRIGFVTVTDVEVSPDLSRATVYWTVMPDDEATVTATSEGLTSAAPALRAEAGRRLHLRRVPRLDLAHDPAPGRGRRIEDRLREVRGDAADGLDGGLDDVTGGADPDDEGGGR